MLKKFWITYTVDQIRVHEVVEAKDRFDARRVVPVDGRLVNLVDVS